MTIWAVKVSSDFFDFIQYKWSLECCLPRCCFFNGIGFYSWERSGIQDFIKRHSTQFALESLVTDAHYFWKHHKIKSRDVKTFGQNLGGQNISADKIFGGQKFSADKIFGTQPNFRHFCPPNFCPIRYHWV